MEDEVSALFDAMVDPRTVDAPPAQIPPPVVIAPDVLPFERIGARRFEVLTARFAMVVQGHPIARLFGTSGQKQYGVDVVARTVDGRYVGYQCKCVREFRAAQLRKAVAEFAENPPLDIDHLTVVVACEGDRTDLELELAELRARYSGLTLEVFYGRELSAMLRAYPEFVEECFGPYWSHAFCVAGAGGRPQSAVRSRPNQLPAALSDFTGRQAEMASLTALATSCAQRTTTVAVGVIVGVGGAGKTTLAVQAAHICGGDFPDGAFYLNLAGSSDSPADPHEAVAMLLRAMGVAPENVPVGEAERVALYRSMTSERRVVIVLDDAVGEAQVRPLLPGGGRSLVLVTSRNRLLGLVDVHRLELELLPPADAVAMLAHIAPQKVGVDTASASAIAELCGRLPLAIRIAGNLLSGRVGWSARYLAAKLADERQRLDELHAGDLDVRSSFELSFRRLPAATRTLFRRLCLIPGPYFDAEAAQFLANITSNSSTRVTTSRQLRDLAELSLIAEHSTDGYYRIHDLIKVFARDVLEQQDQDRDIEDAFLRVAKYFVGNGRDAGRALGAKVDRHGSIRSPRTDMARPAAAWLDDHWANLVATLHALVDRQMLADVAVVAADVSRYVDMRCHYSAWLTVMERARESATVVGHPTGVLFAYLAVEALKDLRRYDLALERIEALIQKLPDVQDLDTVQLRGNAKNVLGVIFTELRRPDEALEAFEDALAASSESGNDILAAMVLHNIAGLYRAKGMYDQAITYYEQDLAMARRIGDVWDEARTLNSLGIALSEAGRDDDGIAALRKARALYRQVGDRRREGHVLNDLGNFLFRLGQTAEARTCLETDLAICSENKDMRGWGLTAVNLAQAMRQEGETDQALALSERALEIMRVEGTLYDLTASLCQLALCNLQAKQVVQALANFEEALATIEKTDDVRAQLECAETYHEILETLRNREDLDLEDRADVVAAKVSALQNLCQSGPVSAPPIVLEKRGQR